MSSEIIIVYIDDRIDEIVSSYLEQNYCARTYTDNTSKLEIKKVYNEVKFNGEGGCQSLLLDTRIRSANVILVDNRLFEERAVDSGRFSGKQFKVLLRKLHPFIEVVIITQDELLIGDNIIHKYSGENEESPDDYYKENLDKALDAAIKVVLECESLTDEMERNTDVPGLLIENIQQSLQGDESYDALTKADIDSLIANFKELKNECQRLQ